MKMKPLFSFALTLFLLTVSATAQTCNNTFGVLFGAGSPSASQCTASTNGLEYVQTGSPGGHYFCQCAAGTASWILTNTTTSSTAPPAGATISNACPANATGGGTQTAVSWIAVPNLTNTWAIDECYDTSNGQLTLLANTTQIQPSVTVSPQSLNFPATNTGATASLSVSVLNTSSTAVTFSGVTLTTGTYYSQTNTCGTLSANQSCTITVTFAPTVVGTLSDTLNIADNASGSPQTVTLTGSGQTPVTPTPSSVTVSPGSPTVAVGATGQESATLHMSDSSVQTLDHPYWNSASTSVATISSTGLITGVATGTSVISANTGYINNGVAEANAGTGPTVTLALPGVSTYLGGSINVSTAWGAATGSVTSVTDTEGNTYTEVAGCLEQANSNSADWWRTTGTPSNTGATNIITVTFAGAGVAFPDVTAVVTQGDTAVDQCAKGTVAAGTSLATTAITPAQASEMILSSAITGNFVKAVNSGAYCITAGNTGQNGIDGKACPVSPAGSSVFFQDTFSTGAVTPTATLNVASTGVISSLALKTVTGTTTATINNTGGTIFSLSSPPAAAAIEGGTSPSYVTSGNGGNAQPSLFNQIIGGNCYDSGGATCPTNTGILTHEITNSDTIAKYFASGGGSCNEPGTNSGGTCEFQILFAPCGTCGKSNSGSADSGCPIYYAQQSDPWYNLSVKGLSLTFHAPQVGSTGPIFSNGSGGDQFVCVYDQAQQIMVQIYKCCTGTGFSMPSSGCSGSGTNTCAANAGSYSYAQAGRLNTDSDWYGGQTYKVQNAFGGNYTLGTSGGGTTGVAAQAAAAMIRFQELANGTISHAIQAGFFCSNYTAPSGGTNGSAGQGGWVFPALSGLLPCGTGGASGTAQNASQPVAGQLFMCDYTSSQISAMSVDPYVKSYLTACSRYGIYFTQTGNALSNGFNIAPGGTESQEAYKAQNVSNPDMATFCSANPTDVNCTGTTTGDEAYLYLSHWIPKTLGPGASDQEGNACGTGSGCYFSGHLHAISSCIPAHYAGVTGGCTP